MFILDFSVSKDKVLTSISNRDHPAWAIPVFDFTQAWFDESMESFEVKTSGSTGVPKVIRHSRQSMIASATSTCDFFHLRHNDTALLALPAAYIGGKMMILRSITRGLKLICVEPKSNPLVSLDPDTTIQFAAFTPMQMSTILDDERTKVKLSQINTIILGGGEVPYPLKQKLQSLSPSIYETYGMTETISHIALKRLNGTDRSDYFTLLDGVKIATDSRGCLVVNAPRLASQTLITNDLINIISDREFQWLGRYDHIINTGGIKVSAEDVERKLQPYINSNFFIAGIPDDLLGQRVVLVIETAQPPSLTIDFASILNKYEKPKEILTIERFSYTENGKVNKKETLKKIH